MRAPYPGARGPAPPCGQQRRHSLLGRRGLGGGGGLDVHCQIEQEKVNFTAISAFQRHTLYLVIVNAERLSAYLFCFSTLLFDIDCE